MTTWTNSRERDDVLETLETYFDTVPREGAQTHRVGPFTVFLPADGASGPGSYYARPALGGTGRITADDVREVVAWQSEHGQQGSIEWVEQVSPTLAPATREAGLAVQSHPLLVLTRSPGVVGADGVVVRVIDAEDPDVVAVRAAVHASFEAGGTARGSGGDRARDEARERLDPQGLDRLRRLMRSGHLVMIGAFDADGQAVGGGTHGPRDGVSELTGIGVLPAFRRRGVGAALTVALARDAVDGGVRTVCCSAQDDEVAGIYEAVGFRRIGAAGEAEVPTP